jgi:hypothetical protein
MPPRSTGVARLVGNDKGAVRVRWRGRILQRGVNPYVLVAAHRTRELRSTGKGPIPVRFGLNGRGAMPWRVNLVPRGDGAFYLYLNGVARTAAKVTVGDRVEVEAAFDLEYQGGPVDALPGGLVRGLARDPVAKRAWEESLPAERRRSLGTSPSSARPRPARGTSIGPSSFSGEAVRDSWDATGTLPRPVGPVERVDSRGHGTGEGRTLSLAIRGFLGVGKTTDSRRRFGPILGSFPEEPAQGYFARAARCLRSASRTSFWMSGIGTGRSRGNRSVDFVLWYGAISSAWGSRSFGRR